MRMLTNMSVHVRFTDVHICAHAYVQTLTYANSYALPFLSSPIMADVDVTESSTSGLLPSDNHVATGNVPSLYIMSRSILNRSFF